MAGRLLVVSLQLMAGPLLMAGLLLMVGLWTAVFGYDGVNTYSFLYEN
jgi:hypothetical protein